MGRPKRAADGGLIYHVLNRANGRLPIFEKDGDYSFLLRYTDQAGNQSDTYEQEEFTLDATPTEVTFEGVEDKSANRGETALRVRMEDTNFDFTNAKMILEVYNH